jgi:dolichyl-phosphate beta-glucosyltransferase
MKKISLIIPTYNENGRIQKTIKSLKKGFNFNEVEFCEIIFSDDGSTDETVSTLKREKKIIEKRTKAKVKIITGKKNKGRGYAIRKAVKNALGDYILYTDADFSIPLNNLKKFVPYIKKNYDVIIGSKKIKGAKEIIKRSFIRRIVGYAHSIIAYFILGIFVWDFQGGFKLFSRRFVENVFPYLQIDRWGFDMEVIFLAKKLNYKLKEIPVRWCHIEKDSKVSLVRDIYRSLEEMIKIKYYWIKGYYQKYLSPRFALGLS